MLKQIRSKFRYFKYSFTALVLVLLLLLVAVVPPPLLLTLLWLGKYITYIFTVFKLKNKKLCNIHHTLDVICIYTFHAARFTLHVKLYKTDIGKHRVRLSYSQKDQTWKFIKVRFKDKQPKIENLFCWIWSNIFKPLKN